MFPIMPVPSHRFVAQRSMLGLAVLMGLLFVVAICALIYIAREENARFVEHSIGDAQKALGANQELIGRALRDYAFWNDAYHHMGRARVDTGWAYTRDNMGTSLYRTYAIEGAFVISPKGETRYALINGKLDHHSIEDFVSGDLWPLFAAARRVADTDRVSIGYYASGGTPALVYAAVMKPTLAPAGVANEQLSLLVYVDLIDAAQLRKWQDNYALAHLEAVLSDHPPASPTYLVSHSEGGSPLQLRWDGEAPGDRLLRSAIPIICALLLGFGLIAAFFYRSTLQSMVLLDRSRERIEHLARHDSLTGLANRAYLQQHLEQQLADRVSANALLYLLSLDLDRFKPVNDQFGHATGDAVLCELAARMQRLLNDTALVARIGGDEFVLVVSATPHDVEVLCAQLCQSFSAPIRVNGHEVEVGVSIGVAAAPTDATLPSELLRLSDIALYEAKAAGRNNWKFYAR
jgi:diguanylate cyclase (GGDEF)-like protein